MLVADIDSATMEREARIKAARDIADAVKAARFELRCQTLGTGTRENYHRVARPDWQWDDYSI